MTTEVVRAHRGRLDVRRHLAVDVVHHLWGDELRDAHAAVVGQNGRDIVGRRPGVEDAHLPNITPDGVNRHPASLFAPKEGCGWLYCR